MIDSLCTQLDWLSANHQQFPELGDEQVHLWWLPLRLDKQQTSIAVDLLSDIQRDKYLRRDAAGLAGSYLAGRYYLLNLIGAYIGKPASEVMLSYTRLNKPYLSYHLQNLEFNFTDTVSYDGTYGLYAFSKNRAVGVDIEALTRLTNFNAIAQRRFSDTELAQVGWPVAADKFLAIWTRKEAYGKATGQGINFKMNQRNLLRSAQAETTDNAHYSFIDEDQNAWQLSQFQPAPGFVAALVYGGDQELDIKAFNSLNHMP